MFWIIFSSIVLIILILIFSPLIVDFEYTNDKLKIKLKYLFIRKRFFEPDKKTSEKKIRKKPEKDKSGKKKKDKKSKKNRSEKLTFYKQLIKPCKKTLVRIIKHTKIKDIYIDFTISDLDAYECAIKFGKMNIIVYNALSYLGNFVKLKKKSINIKCVYNKPKCIYDIKFKIYISPAVLIATTIVFIYSILVNNIKAAYKAKRKENSNNSPYGGNGESYE